MSRYNMLVSRKKIEYIAHNIKITEHAKKRIKERLGDDVNITEMILNSPFWYRNISGHINIAIDQLKYFVVDEACGVFKLVTIAEPSKNGYDIMDKFVCAYMGIEQSKGECEND